MTTIIAKNVSGGDIFLDDLGIDLATDSTTELNLLFSIYLISESSDLRDSVSNGDIVINDGNSDLSVSDGLDHLLLETEYEDDLSKRNAWDSQTNEPTPEDYGGWLDTDESILYSYNSSRDKWLSVDRRILTFHKEGEVSNGFMRIGGDLLTANNGYLLERNATLLEAIARSTGGPTDAHFKVFENSNNVYNFQFTGNLYAIDTTANIDLSSGSIIKCQALGGTTQLDWFYDDWNYRRKITIDADQISGSSSLNNFPVLIYINNSDLNKARSDGFDILFASPIDSTSFVKLDHEIESFNQSSGILWAWVRIPELSAIEDTDLYIYYGNVDSTNQQNVTAVWDSNYMGVWHFNEDLEDSTTNNNDGNNNGTTDITGKIADGRDFERSNTQYVNVPDSASLELSDVDRVTVQAWINKESTPSISWMAVVQKSDQSYNLQLQNAALPYFTIYDTTWNSAIANGNITNGQWVYLVGTFDGSTIRLYVNGVLQTTTDTASSINSAAGTGVGIGENLDSTGRHFDGQIDEVRISDIARSADWITTEYNNQNAPQNFYNIGDEQTKIITDPTDNPLVQLTIAWRK